MILSNLKIILRNLIKNPATTIINLLGFSVGIAVAFLIFTYVSHEFSYETYHKNADNIYRAHLHLSVDGEDKEVTVSPNILGPRMKEKIGGIESYARMFTPLNTTATILINDDHYKVREFYEADSTISEIFTIDIYKGDDKSILTRPEDALLSEKTANQFYGSTDVLGKSFETSYGEEFIVRGVYRDFPDNTHFKPEIIVSALSGQITGELTWNQSNYFTYILIPGRDIREINKELNDLVQAEAPDWMKQMDVAFTLFPIKDIHLKSKADFEPVPTADIKQVYASIIVAIFVLVIACVNYINLTTSRSLERAREVGLRKVMGGMREHLIRQFLMESFVITFLSFLLAILLIALFLPAFNQLVGLEFNMGDFINSGSILYIAGAWIVLSLMAGFYPSLLLTSFSPTQVLKGSFKKSKSGTLARKILVIFQFVISTSLIIGTIIVYNQVNYMNNRDLGFDKEHTLILPISGNPEKGAFSGLKNTYLQHNQIKAVSFSSAYPTRNSGGQMFNGEGMADDEQIMIWEWRIDEDVIDAFGLELLAGKNFNKQASESETKEFIINETAADIMGWSPEEAVGKRSRVNQEKGVCIGVVKDFHYTSLKNEVEPLVLHIKPDFRNNMVIRLGEGDIKPVMAFLEEEWEEQLPGLIFDYQFIDEAFDRLYKNERRTSQMFSGFSILAIIIAGLGLFGLSTYETQLRTKEIGIRKALGSTAMGIFKLLIRSFTVLVFISFLISIPLSYYLMESWLEGFAYRIQIEISVFVFAGMLTFLIVLFSVGYRSMIASLQNPVKSLRYE